MTPNRRRRGFLGFDIDMSISARWLLVIVIIGLVQFGTFLAELRAIRTDMIEIKTSSKLLVNIIATISTKDAEQDTRLFEVERRLNVREQLNPLERKRH